MCLDQIAIDEDVLCLKVDSPAQNQFDLELWYKVFFFTDSCRLDITIEDSG